MNFPVAKELAEHLRFHYLDGRITEVDAHHQTSWRFMPWTVVVQVLGGDFEVALGDERVIPGRAGNCLLGPDLRHRVRITSGAGQAPIVCRWAHVDFTIFETINLLSLFELPVVVAGEMAGVLGDLCERMHRIAFASGTGELQRAVALEHAGYEMLEAILELGKPRRDFTRFFLETQRFAGVLGLIARESTRPFSVAELAAVAGLSPSRFHAAFQQVFGISPMAYLRNHRLEQARLLLSASDLTVAQVAYRIGYRDPFHFSRHFKRRFGASPAAFRAAIHP